MRPRACDEDVDGLSGDVGSEHQKGDADDPQRAASGGTSTAPSRPRTLRKKNATPSGIAVSASPALWIKSASSATEFENEKTATCAPAVNPRISRLSATAFTPARERRIDRSTSPCE
jgi:hypothetical protein